MSGHWKRISMAPYGQYPVLIIQTTFLLWTNSAEHLHSCFSFTNNQIVVDGCYFEFGTSWDHVWEWVCACVCSGRWGGSQQLILITTRLANPSAVTAWLLLQWKQVSFRGRAAPGWSVRMVNPCVCHRGRGAACRCAKAIHVSLSRRAHLSDLRRLCIPLAAMLNLPEAITVKGLWANNLCKEHQNQCVLSTEWYKPGKQRKIHQGARSSRAATDSFEYT